MTTAAQNLPILLTVRQTADWLSVSSKTVRRWIVTGELPFYRIGRSIRIAEPDLIAFIKLNRAT